MISAVFRYKTLCNIWLEKHNCSSKLHESRTTVLYRMKVGTTEKRSILTSTQQIMGSSHGTQNTQHPTHRYIPFSPTLGTKLYSALLSLFPNQVDASRATHTKTTARQQKAQFCCSKLQPLFRDTQEQTRPRSAQSNALEVLIGACFLVIKSVLNDVPIGNRTRIIKMYCAGPIIVMCC